MLIFLSNKMSKNNHIFCGKSFVTMDYYTAMIKKVNKN